MGLLGYRICRQDFNVYRDIFDASQSKISFILLVNQVSGHFQEIMMFEEIEERKKKTGVIFLYPHHSILAPSSYVSL